MSITLRARAAQAAKVRDQAVALVTASLEEAHLIIARARRKLRSTPRPPSSPPAR